MTHGTKRPPWVLDVEVGKLESGGRLIYVTPRSQDVESGMEAHVGPVDYIATYSHAYEMPSLVEYLRATFPPDLTIAYIDNLMVHPDRRGRGLGSALMKRMLEELQKEGAIHVFGHMAEWEGPARKRLRGWLKKFGFEVVDCCHEDKLPVVALTLGDFWYHHPRLRAMQ